MTEVIGRRERKKAQTRKALADAALELFLARGYDQVGVKEVADAADVSVTTLFKYFPSKEALVFDQDEDIEEALVLAVHGRPPGYSVVDALREHLLRLAKSAPSDEFRRLIESEPALRDYARRMWMRHETALARAIAEEMGAPEGDVACAALARFALASRELILADDHPRRAAEEIFARLQRGWRTE
ncbi:TetR/AcrR family transcriptional regulator [Amycolatopsis sp. NPDC058278]|jgi:AcrR family transcriptional regulator|uniref:TetR/AcrR family transcriptional regulator n=1 Tax=unclassified Amycolatopsis TaxID=2618356 RepID=UPI00255B8E98|nr:TetR/AcrR family transcriptional regulator [Amycolatopsis sp. DG1A-15b]WIX89542.1 TetR family transcriptional regulator [Amycolatopsis sp. DG1A-15b]